MSVDPGQPNDNGPVSGPSPGWQWSIDTTPEGSGWHRWSATETNSGKTATGPAAVFTVMVLVVMLLFTELFDGDDNDEPVEVYRSEDWWVARHVELGVASQGESREAALDNLQEAVELHRGEADERIETEEEERELLRELGIDPDEVMNESKDLPKFMQ